MCVELNYSAYCWLLTRVLWVALYCCMQTRQIEDQHLNKLCDNDKWHRAGRAKTALQKALRARQCAVSSRHIFVHLCKCKFVYVFRMQKVNMWRFEWQKNEKWRSGAHQPVCLIFIIPYKAVNRGDENSPLLAALWRAVASLPWQWALNL